MTFGPVAPDEAEGTVLAHSQKVGGATFKKGRILSADDVTALKEAGFQEVIVARYGPEDVPEDEAARELAAALAGPGIRAGEAFTGRANLFADADGVIEIDRHRLDHINIVDEAITLATLEPFSRVSADQMVATVKIIPFAAPRGSLDLALKRGGEPGPLLHLHPFKPHRAGLVATRLPDTKESVLDKTRAVLDERLNGMGSEIAREIRCGHDEREVSAAVTELLTAGLSPILVFGASATVDRRDVVPAGIELSGGEIEHFGMPVDPGNLLLLATHGQTPVIGLPGCARSPKLNGFDWVLARTLAGLTVEPKDIMLMGAGGLLKEIATRPQPRAGKPRKSTSSAPKIAAILLAAGTSTRMGEVNKLTEEVDGSPMVARVADAALTARVSKVVVVTGHEREKGEAALGPRNVGLIQNLDYDQGLSTSLKAGIAALPDAVDGAVVLLGDMPDVTAAHIDRLIAAFDPEEGRAICVPTWEGKRGNPVLWSAEYFEEIQSLTGDTGAKQLFAAHADEIAEVPMPDDATLKDIDLMTSLEARRKRD
jgi:molybdenum cofactor cytidylyltransferase